jgi:hypothetical protein|tara:strand:+ start:321 stop:707 length:387 start_codon:yes stop_codon:yes gene_type:complete
MELLEKSIPETIQELVGNNGIFHIKWNKKDTRKYLENYKLNPNYNKHTIKREGNFRLGVKKHLVGKKRTTKPSDYMIAFDMSKQGYRNIFYNSIEQIKANGITYYVKIVDTKYYRLGAIEVLTKKDIN